MSDEVLVAYATRHESTRAIAAEIAHELVTAGVRARLEPVEAVGDLRAFRAVIVGCTVFGQEWMPGAYTFLSVHERQLETMPVWLFASGPAEPLPASTRMDVAPELVAVIERIAPRDVALFAGPLQPHHLLTGLRAMTRLSRSAFTDYRDRAAVERWARHIAQELHAAPAASAEPA